MVNSPGKLVLDNVDVDVEQVADKLADRLVQQVQSNCRNYLH
jgi:hypothetical protein